MNCDIKGDVSEKMDLVIEKLNDEWFEIYNSKEYRVGTSILSLFRCVKTFDLRGVYNIFRDKRVYSIVKRKYVKKQEEIFANREIIQMDKKLVIYTCVLGGYDVLEQPISVWGDNVEFVVFSDEIREKSIGIWKVREIPQRAGRYNNNTLINRYIKMHPYELFGKEYDYAMYIDGNVRIIGNPYTYLGIASKSNIGVAMYMHKERDCIYDEALVCKLYGKGNKSQMESQLERYKKEGFPKHYGMYEATIIVADLSMEKGNVFFELWWKEFVESNSNRDQLSLPYVLWKNNIGIEGLGVIGNNILRDRRIRVVRHTKHN